MKNMNKDLDEQRMAIERNMDNELDALTGGKSVNSDPVDGEYWFHSPGKPREKIGLGGKECVPRASGDEPA